MPHPCSFDPIFFLHHAFVDKLFALWQQVGGPVVQQHAGGRRTLTLQHV